MKQAKGEKEYRVSWEIDISAGTPEEAVMLAVGAGWVPYSLAGGHTP